MTKEKEHHPFDDGARRINLDYLQHCSIAELCWFMDTALNLLKEKALRVEMDAKQYDRQAFAGLE
jgi:hypothetical protein